jgi:hypothetical protein
MLQPTNPKAIECYDRAARARKLALECSDALQRADYFESGARWVKLAERYEFAARLPDFLKAPRPAIEPRCALCAVPMWLVRVEPQGSEDPSRLCRRYECKVCDAKLVLPEASEN